MRAPRSIPAAVRRQQNAACDPEVSAWVAANAGSGKTYVLAQRVINLLLQGVAPEKILCITFTRAAAANMAKQVFERLAAWTALDDTALDAAIREHCHVGPDRRRRALARRLFARALETPGGLKVQTVHAFCTQLLHQFPFEANVAARFSVLDAAEQSQLLERLTLSVLLDGAAAPEGALAGALEAAMTVAADRTFRDVVREAIGKRDAIDNWVRSAGGLEPAIAALASALGVEASDSVEKIEAEFFAGAVIAPAEWPKLAAILGRGGKTDREQALRFAGLAGLSGRERVETYLDIFCTSGARRPRRSIVTGAIDDGALVERLRAEQDRVCALLKRHRALACRDRSAALLTVAHEVLTRYAEEKRRRGLIDYDDLIDKALALLTDVEAAWVHYKLDLGIDHVLVDEAQDTSHKQWEIVRRLTAEFTAGAGARNVRRTVFAVGDEKQSIYSFQDAAPQEFAEMQRHFRSAHENSGQKFVVSKFEHSFRSGAAVLGAVNAVFKRKNIAPSVTSDQDGFPPHNALPDTPPGVVEIWEPHKPDERKAIEGWEAPFDTVSETSPRVRLARRIARTVQNMVEDGRAHCGDIMVLVRQRGELFEAIIRALKTAGVQVAGADRLMLTEHIAVMDLMVLAEALLLPEDDLALATALRSPLFGFEDQDLYDIARDRGRRSLRSALARRCGERPIFADAAQRLDRLAQAARRELPFAFYARLLGEEGGRRRILARLGPEANDALDEFLNLALDYERRETPSLQGFLAWLRDARAEVRRDMESARDEVRVMTVHGAKGLEAPVVILADTMTPPAGPRPPRLLLLANGAIVWAGRKDDDVPAVAAARRDALAAAEHEYRRLLYVAMTRAADRLIVCGADGIRSRPKDCWYDLVRDPLDPLLIAAGENEEKVLRYGGSQADDAAPPVAMAPAPGATAERRELPSWLRLPAPAAAPRPTSIAPSSALEDESGRGADAAGSAADRQRALTRGLIIHRLMRSVPDVPPPRRMDAIERFLSRAAADFLPAEQAEIARQVLAILDDGTFAELFAAGSRAEVPIIGRIARAGAAPILVSGQVDRLAVTDAAVLIADYKTDRTPPRGIERVQEKREPVFRPDARQYAALADTPLRYIAQLALYRAVLARIYPEKTIRAALIFTAGPIVIDVPGAAMDAALTKIP